MTGSTQFTSAHLTETIGKENFFPTVQAAVEWCIPAATRAHP
jgi:hypothetical protein